MSDEPHRLELPRSIAEMPTTAARFIGKSPPRVEDRMLLTGRTEFIDNVTLPGMLHCAILRSPYPHANITRIDTSAAEALPGVVAVITSEDCVRWTRVLPTMPPGWGTYSLAHEKVRFVGEPVAAVAAASRYIAEDALELIEVDYEPLPPVVDPVQAMEAGSPLIFEENGTNVMYQRFFQWGDVDRLFAEADRVVSDTFRWHRVGANPLETFGVVSKWDPVDESLTCYGSFQAPSYTARGRAAGLQIPSNKVRFVGQPHGGSFGGKGGGRGTDASALLSRKAGGRPVKWIEDRMELLIGGSSQAWDRHYEASLALKADGTVTAFRVKLIDDLGATAEGFGASGAAKPLACFTGCYAIEAASYDLTIVATNKVPASPYRGMGPPPHNFVLEYLMDMAARELDLDPAEIRRRNFIPPDKFPYTIPSGNEYDSGNYGAALDKLLEMADYQKLRAEQEAARAQGRCLGIGVVSTIEPGVFDWGAYAIVGARGTGVPEGATVSIDVWGKIIVRVGFPIEGQGQYTLITQLMSDYFGVSPEDVQVVMPDTLEAPPHFGPGGSRLGVAITGAVLGAATVLKDKMIRVAAQLLQLEPEAMELMDGKIREKANPERALTVQQAAGTMLMRADLLPPGMEPTAEATYVWTAPDRTVGDEQGRSKGYLTATNACHLVLLEVDAETGAVQILKYYIVDDCGTRLNPATLEGMIQGAVAQGVGAALYEEYFYDDSGQPLTTTFMDYLLPTVHEVPMTEKASLVTPSPFTPLGAKGAGEGAINTTPAAILCAINDALRPLGARAREVPATPQRLWRLIQDAQALK
jgi:carbon-monoxide dehydrogenase large subunit